MQLVVISVGHMGVDVVVQQVDAFSEFNQTFVIDYGMQLLKCVTATVWIDCVVTWF
jgi:hypothetical protein